VEAFFSLLFFFAGFIPSIIKRKGGINMSNILIISVMAFIGMGAIDWYIERYEKN